VFAAYHWTADLGVTPWSRSETAPDPDPEFADSLRIASGLPSNPGSPLGLLRKWVLALNLKMINWKGNLVRSVASGDQGNAEDHMSHGEPNQRGLVQRNGSFILQPSEER